MTPIFKSFLGLNLKTGCYFFGYTQLTVQLMVTIVLFVIQSRMDPNVGEKVEMKNIRMQTIGKMEITQQNVNMFAIMLVILMDCFSVVLLMGLHMNKRKLVKAYLGYSGVSLLLSALLFTVGLAILTYVNIIGATTNQMLHTMSIFDVVVAGVVCSLPQIYFFLLVLSYYQEIEMDGRELLNDA